MIESTVPTKNFTKTKILNIACCYNVATKQLREPKP